MEPVPWSPDLTPLDYFLWGSMKRMVYGTPVTSEEDLIARAHRAIESLIRLYLVCTVYRRLLKISLGNFLDILFGNISGQGAAYN